MKIFIKINVTSVIWMYFFFLGLFFLPLSKSFAYTNAKGCFSLPPINVTATPNVNKITLTWDADPQSFGYPYFIRRSTEPLDDVYFGYGNIPHVYAQVSGSEAFVDENVEPGVVYYYQVGEGIFDHDGIRLLCANAKGYVTTTTGNCFTKVADLDELHPGAVSWGDFDDDGDLDVALRGGDLKDGSSKNLLKLYKNENSSGSGFSEVLNLNDFEIGGINVFVRWGDYDNDGDLDLLFSGVNDDHHPEVYVYRNDDSNNLTFTKVATFPGVFHGDAQWVDYDNDGDLDFFISGEAKYSEQASILFENTGGDEFQSIDLKINISNQDADWGDFDSDGDMDLLLQDDQGLSIYQNNSDESPSFTRFTTLIKIYRSDVEWGDFDADGDLDILVIGSEWNVTSQSWLPFSAVYQNENQEFTKINLQDPIQYGAVIWGDYDNDGDLDILISGTKGDYPDNTYHLRIYRNEGNSFLLLNYPELIGISEGELAWGDYDNDGDLDILSTGYSKNGEIAKIYRNDCASYNTPPSVPANLTSVVSDGVAELNWEAATDNQTPQAGLTYNLKVGTTERGEEILSAMAHANGLRKIAHIGNTNQNTSWSIRNLPVGKYYWSVQAIDNTFTGSSFTSTSFEIQPGGVGGIQIKDITAGTAKVEWDRVSDAIYYELKLTEIGGLSNGGGTTIILPVIYPVQNNLITLGTTEALKSGTNYECEIRSVGTQDGSVTSEWSAPKRFRTADLSNSCRTPKGMNATISGSNTVKLQWANSNADYYVIRYKNKDLASPEAYWNNYIISTSNVVNISRLYPGEHIWQVASVCRIDEKFLSQSYWTVLNTFEIEQTGKTKLFSDPSESKHSWIVSPNPFSENITINSFKKESEKVAIQIFSAALGKEVYKNLNYELGKTISLNNNLREGLYIVRITSGASLKTFRIHKTK